MHSGDVTGKVATMVTIFLIVNSCGIRAIFASKIRNLLLQSCLLLEITTLMYMIIR